MMQSAHLTTSQPPISGRSYEKCAEDLYPSLAVFSSGYHQVHVYLSLILCVFGIGLNCLNVVVLCQKHMRNSNNLLLSSLAISDGLVMFIYIIYDLGFRLVARLENGMTKDYAYLLLVCIVGQNLFHTFSTWIIVVLAAYRLLYVHAGPQARVVCAPLRVWFAIAMIALTSIVLTVPLVFAHEVTQYRKPNSNISGLFEVDYVDNSVLQTILFLNSALLVKAIPILLIWVLSTILINKIRETQLTRRRLLPPETIRSSFTFPSPSTGCSADVERLRKLHWFFFKSCGGFDACRQSAQPTKMLLAVALMYIITYLPQSVMLILNRYMGRCFQTQVYERLGDLMDLLTLSNNGINFIIYCVMSAQFRNTFVALLTSGRSKLRHF
uniref:G_PROTEIN_RECEP_F1_2 domain-containing protein n=1 Tax=Mesocestoides corti TaxID=53468 RepID=A0A5K3EJP8_MESCO